MRGQDSLLILITLLIIFSFVIVGGLLFANMLTLGFGDAEKNDCIIRLTNEASCTGGGWNECGEVIASRFTMCGAPPGEKPNSCKMPEKNFKLCGKRP